MADTPIAEAIAFDKSEGGHSHGSLLEKVAHNHLDAEADLHFLASNPVPAKQDPVLASYTAKNKEWQQAMVKQDPEFFSRWAKTQKPDILWIGCVDSRVPPNVLLGLPPGDVFVHRNIANTVIHSDLSVMSVLEYGIKYLKVTRVVLCGHTECGGVKAANSDHQYGTIDAWLRHIRDTKRIHYKQLSTITDEKERLNRLIDLHALEQCHNIAVSTPVQEAWASGQELTVNVVVYDVGTGKLKDLGVSASKPADISGIYKLALGGHHH
mmetsp:Transcript_9232/g.16124  ORF Transcript_9232/g.16124 Transcript_9232/m.16124 type:complete len:267 (+) Transcript_9232:78-878(+)|eukprot:CAMPEP_0184700040 /NCGR_PEP_ID=MMETSP0313-20130426/7743_1 /TAXON_ID=2792 /ORGANISM="Porphyridium aerugineum, Strain SAG 1380-2" /LENGTH=266 /DNA_ID=CAMNT_0027159393 /DNA_START=52 /DNA_END=852 /DNA_ORIENTATION=-